MTIFRAFLGVLRKNLIPIVISVVMLVIFGGLSVETGVGGTEFIDDKPDVTIVDLDEGEIAQGLVRYLSEKTNLVEVENNEDRLKDALFYRETNFIVYIPEGFSEDFVAGENPVIEFQGSGDYQAAFAEMILSRYMSALEKAAREVKGPSNKADLEKEIVVKADKVVEVQLDVEVLSRVDTASAERAARFFNFESYALLNSLVFIIAIMMLVFNEPKVYRRLLVSATSPSRQNRILLILNLLFAGVIWVVYSGLGFVVLGIDQMCSLQGMWFLINSLIFTICATSVAFLVGVLIRNKNALNGVTNVIALGSSFLCGAFVPQAWLPSGVLTVAHVLPTYYYIRANELIAEMEVLDLEVLGKLLLNLGIMLAFTLGFVILMMIVSRMRRRE